MPDDHLSGWTTTGHDSPPHPHHAGGHAMDCPLCGRTDALDPMPTPRDAAVYPRRRRAPDALSGRWVQLEPGVGSSWGPSGARATCTSRR